MQVNRIEGSSKWVELLESCASDSDKSAEVVKQNGRTYTRGLSDQEILDMVKKIFEELKKELKEGKLVVEDFNDLSSRVYKATKRIVKNNLKEIKKERAGTRFQRGLLRIISIVAFLFGGFFIHQALNAEDKKYEQKIFLASLFDTVKYDAAGAKSIRESFLGKEINLTEINITNKNEEVISVLDTFYRDFPRGDYYLNGVLFNRKKPEANLTKLRDTFTSQQLKNLTLVLNQASFANPLVRLTNELVSKNLLPKNGNYIEYRIEKIKNTQLVKVTLITNLEVKEISNVLGKAKGYVGYGADIYISEDELNQDWLNENDVAPKMRVVDYFSPMQKTPKQSIKFAQQASEILRSSFIQIDS